MQGCSQPEVYASQLCRHYQLKKTVTRPPFCRHVIWLWWLYLCMIDVPLWLTVRQPTTRTQPWLGTVITLPIPKDTADTGHWATENGMGCPLQRGTKRNVIRPIRGRVIWSKTPRELDDDSTAREVSGPCYGLNRFQQSFSTAPTEVDLYIYIWTIIYSRYDDLPTLLNSTPAPTGQLTSNLYMYFELFRMPSFVPTLMNSTDATTDFEFEHAVIQKD